MYLIAQSRGFVWVRVNEHYMSWQRANIFFSLSTWFTCCPLYTCHIFYQFLFQLSTSKVPRQGIEVRRKYAYTHFFLENIHAYCWLLARETILHRVTLKTLDQVNGSHIIAHFCVKVRVFCHFSCVNCLIVNSFSIVPSDHLPLGFYAFKFCSINYCRSKLSTCTLL